MEVEGKLLTIDSFLFLSNVNLLAIHKLKLNKLKVVLGNSDKMQIWKSLNCAFLF